MYLDGYGEIERMGDPVTVPEWLTDPADRAKWLTLSDRDRSDWARAHGSAVASGLSAYGAEQEGKIRERVQAAVMDIAADRGALAATPVIPWYTRHRGLLIVGGVGLAAYLILRRPRQSYVANRRGR